jgi:trehalose synthase
MTIMDEATIDALPPERFGEVLDAPAYRRLTDALRRGTRRLQGHTMWHVNTVLKGGGVAEMLASLLPYVRGAGIDCRWVVVAGSPEFLTITKRLHNLLHGYEGDGGELGEAEARCYAETMAANAAELLPRVRPGDVVFVHDPQTAGLIPALKRCGARVVWHCHIGADEPNDHMRRAWRFLAGEVAPADRHIFSRPHYLWDGLPPDRLRVIQPSIDAFSPKNQHLDPATVDAILTAAGVLEGTPPAASFRRSSGETGTVSRRVALIDGSRPVPRHTPVLLQAARWDRLKDPAGLIALFRDHLAAIDPRIRLVIAGPSVDGVGDDPEGRQVLDDCIALRRALPAGPRDRVHLLCSPMDDEEEAGVIVNALQRCADVVMLKSLAEGFGLAVSEAMWKQRPVVSTRVGGIQDQIEHGESGILVDDPGDRAAFAAATAALLSDRARARDIGARAHDRVRDRFLAPRQLTETMDLVCELR